MKSALLLRVRESLSTFHYARMLAILRSELRPRQTKFHVDASNRISKISREGKRNVARTTRIISTVVVLSIFANENYRVVSVAIVVLIVSGNRMYSRVSIASGF